jgi:antitoxin ParD1/3/4
MQTMNVSLPDSLTEYIQQQVVRLGYENTDDYFRELVEADQWRKEKRALEAEVLRGLECKEMIPLTDEVWNQMRETLNERLRVKRGTQS